MCERFYLITFADVRKKAKKKIFIIINLYQEKPKDTGTNFLKIIMYKSSHTKEKSKVKGYQFLRHF